MLSLRRSTLVMALTALAGCDSLTAPGGVVAGTYALRLLDGATLPHVIAEAGDWRTTLVADTLRLDLIGGGARVRVYLTEKLSDPSVRQLEDLVTEVVWFSANDGLRLSEIIGCLVSHTSVGCDDLDAALSIRGHELTAGVRRYQRVGFGF